MRRFKCNLTVILNFQDNATEESDVEEAIRAILQRLRMTSLEFEDTEEIDINEEEEDDDDDDPVPEYDDGNYHEWYNEDKDLD